tara:strand:+ start:3758 stop:4051 length:294 start_codon:yes stop_codon:yes gene_type:complete
MDYKTLIDWHCSGNVLDEDDIEILEIELTQSIKAIAEISSIDIAPPHICKVCLLSENSLWISCLAKVLDQLRPIKIGQSRVQKLFNLLCQYDLIIND